MKNIVEKAIEGGWIEGEYYEMRTNAFVLDPLFWQALGKVCGWKDGFRPYIARGPLSGIDHHMTQKTHAWQYHALRFHEINLTEGWNEAVSYLKGLIK